MEFQQTLKAIYNRQDKIAPLIEGLEEEIPQQTLDDYYVKLKIIIKEDDDKKQGNYEAISGQKQEVEMENIFCEPSIRRLLILGGAGVGKSTLMQYMAYRWSTSGLWNDKFDYVYRVPLKVLLNTGWEHAYNINQRQDELKCLIHHNLIAQGAGGDLKLEDMPWLEKKEKILLLLDGYDEVAHERNGTFKGLFESIFKHENIILTSRPNAIDKRMAEKFGRRIENTGLDYDGIGKYLTQYFKSDQEKGEALKEFLEKNSSIKEICHIPVNIAMLCFIWAEGDSNSALHEISNMSDLYKQVVDHLGFRYFTRQQTNPRQNQDELISQWKGGEIHLDELQVLEHTAYKAMTGGGIQVPDDQRVETLIIKGMTKKGDKQGISLQSSINYLAEKLSKSIPTINRVYKYGLLKPEGAIIDTSSQKQKKEPSETDLQEQSFSFIHLSFQEFLTAFYFVKSLLKENNKEEQENIANFIAQHRNEPRYLMTLKLMAGLLSSHDEGNMQAEQGIKIFWDAVMCNPDGVLELGVEAKVTLFMHLLSQGKKDGIMDKRIPNLQIALDLIDSIVLQDLTRWSSSLKESDYISENIKEGLIQFFIKDNKSWISEMSSKLQEKFTKQGKKAHPITLEAAVEILSLTMTKFSQDQQDQIYIKLTQLVKNHNETTWRLTKKALETLLTMHQKSKVKLGDGQISAEELLGDILGAAYDSNLTHLSLKAIQEILNVTANPLLMEKIKENITQTQENIKAEAVVKTKNHLLTITPLDDPQFIKDVVNQSFAPFLQDSIRDVRTLAFNAITEIVDKTNDEKLLQDTMPLLLPLLKYPESKVFYYAKVKTLIEKSNSYQLIEERITLLTPLIKKPDESTRFSAPREISQLIMIKGGTINIQLVSDIFVSLIMTPVFRDLQKKETLDNLTKEIVDLICFQIDAQSAQAIVRSFKPLYEQQNLDARTRATMTGMEIIKVVGKDNTQFTKDIIVFYISLLNTPSCGEAFEHFKHLLSWEAQLCPFLLEKMAPVLPNWDDFSLNSFQEILLADSQVCSQFGRDIIDVFTSLLKNPDEEIRYIAVNTIESLFQKNLQTETEYTTEFIKKSLLPLLQDPDDLIKIGALRVINPLGVGIL